MKTIIFLVVVASFYGLSSCKPQEKYTTKYDNIDLDAIIRNDRLLRNYIDCVLGKKKCTKDGEELKVHLPDALQSDCSKCSEAQRNGSRKIITHLLKNKRGWFNELQAKYDPAGNYLSKYSDELRKEGIVI
ncbi:ejaculatory bulb-specific protein 3 [Dendroctonus ponderosae]|uniref:Uncharacterized protein n=1 Tax=Dendroctonus ponderosae TaxID=77166 RepID=J3JYG1_DENPD|nr:ejaculatory bulb-specific protein 3 [Dendroctonus ponderosae]AEE63247.1 unknown [Dendroctonus ponderosae]